MVYIFDNVHGHIHFSALEQKYLDNRWTKRLKRIKQLGLIDHVFPCASHSRFEHSVGVYHLAEKYINILERNSKNIQFTDESKMCVKLAGLFHDLGHGPFSHIFDNGILRKNSATHEMRSRNIVEYIFKDVGTQPGFTSAYTIDYIKEMIEPVGNIINSNNMALYSIVNNTRNSIDVDKFDYLLRDTAHIGLDYSFNYERIFNKSYIYKNQIIYDNSLIPNILDLFLTRYKFHKDVCNHKTVKLIELMFADALKLANNVYGFDDIIQTEDFLQLDDSIYSQILFSSNKDLQQSKQILQRIENRQLYKLLWTGKYKSKDELNEIIEDNFSDYNTEHLRTITTTLNLCNGNKSPLENILFRKNKTIQSYPYTNTQLYPVIFEENNVMIYYTAL